MRMKLHFFIYLILCFLGVCRAFGGLSCNDVLNGYSFNASVVQVTGHSSAEEKEVILNAVEKVFSLYPDLLQRGLNVSLFMNSSEPSSTSISPLLWSRPAIFIGSGVKNAYALYGMMIHELAHLVAANQFWKTQKFFINDSHGTLFEFFKIWGIEVIGEKELKEIFSLAEKNPALNIFEYQRLAELMDDSNDGPQGEHDELMRALRRKKDHFRKFITEVHLPYEELFADALAVVISQNPEIIAQAVPEDILNFHRVTNPRHYQPRSFHQPLPFDHWQVEPMEMYTKFDPTRFFLWQSYLKGMALQNIPIFFEAFWEATGQHIRQRQERGEILSAHSILISNGQLNREFLQMLIVAARKRGFEPHVIPFE